MKTFPANVSLVFITIVVSFTYNVLLDEDLECTCKNVVTDCCLYMALPFFIFFGLMLWTDKVCLSSCKYASSKCECCNATERAPRPQDGNGAEVRIDQVGEANDADDIADLIERANERREAPKCCGKSCCGVCGIIIIHTLKAGIVGLLWVISVLIDGSWYVCCLNSKHPQLACKDKTNLTAEEHVIIAELKNESRTIGFCILLVIVCLAILMSAFDWRRCCKGKCSKISCCCFEVMCSSRERYCRKVQWGSCKENCCVGKGGCCDRRVIYDELIFKKSEDVLMEVLSEAAKYELRQAIERKISEEQWTECFDVVKEMIENPKDPELPEREEENRAGREEQR